MMIFDSPRVRIETKGVHLPNGTDREYLFVQPVDAVCILPTDDTYVYLIRQYRAVIDQYILEVPAGGMDHGNETPLEAAQRELAEETGMQAAEYIDRGYVYTSPGFCTEKLWLFEARGLSACTGHAMDPDEIIEPVKIPKADVFKMIQSGEIADAKTITLLTRALVE